MALDRRKSSGLKCLDQRLRSLNGRSRGPYQDGTKQRAGDTQKTAAAAAARHSAVTPWFPAQRKKNRGR
jgi:hypothetical protein